MSLDFPKNITMKNLYSHLLSVLSNHVWDGEINSPEFAQYLQSLQPSVRKLRASYQTPIRVIVNYDDEQIQASYWLAYYPHYVQMTEKILAQLSEKGLLDRFHHQIEKQLFQTSGELNLSILAAGAIPEAVAISNYIKTHFPVEDYGTIRGHLNIHTFDVGYEEWKTTRLLTSHLLPNYYPSPNFRFITHQVDLLQKESLHGFKDIIKQSHLLIFQNCLNELAGEKEDHFVENFYDALNHISFGASVIVSDLQPYLIGQKLIQKLATSAIRLSDLGIFANFNLNQNVSQARLPKVVTNNLLTGESGLIPRRRTKYMFLFVEKVTVEAAKSIDQGNRHFESRHWKSAIAHYTKALEFYPHSYFSYTRRALAYRKNGEYEKAINDYTNAFRLCQGKAEDYYHRSIAYRQLQQYQCALKDCNQAIDLKPHLAPAYNHRGNLLVDLEDYDSAIENYKVALEIDPNFAIAYNNQGVAYSKLNQYQKARKSYDLAIKLNPNYKKAIQNRAKITSFPKVS